MMNLITLLGLINTGTNLVGNIAEGIGNAISGQGETGLLEGAEFSNLLNNSQQNLQAGLNNGLSAKTSLDITPQSGAGGIIPASPVTSLPQQNEEISDATLEALNQILSGEKPADIEILADDTENNSGGILGNTKLNDPFGIEQAKQNGSPIANTAVTSLIPAQSEVSNVNVETGEVLTSTEVSNSGNISNTKENSANSLSGLEFDKNKALNITLQGQEKADAKIADANQVKNFGAENLVNKDNKILENKSSAVNAAIEKVIDKTITINNPNSAYFGVNINKDENRAIGDFARAARSKDALKDRTAEMDAYKIVNVSRKDNILDLRLEPASLGKVQIKFDFAADGRTNIMVIADRQETLDMMKRDTDSIQKILSDNGIKSESGSLSFDLRQQQQNNDNFNFFSGKPISFAVQEELNKIAANDDINNINLAGYGVYANTGLLNIMV